MTLWQTKYRSQLLLTTNQATEVFELDGLFVEKRSLGLGQYGLFVLGINDTKKIKEDELIALCKKSNALFIQIETYDLGENIFLHLEKFKKDFYKKFITPYTAFIDLEKTEEEILKAMKQNGRYNIKLAKKKGISVYEAEKTTDNIEIFYNLMQETTSRNNFSGNTLFYYENFLKTIPGSALIFTKYEEKIISAGIFVFDTNISIYYYGASTSDTKYRNMMAPYLMQWFAITKAKALGAKYYDFLGIAQPNDTHSSLLGVTQFKLKLTKKISHCSEGYIFIQKKFLYILLRFLKKIKSRLG